MGWLEFSPVPETPTLRLDSGNFTNLRFSQQIFAKCNELAQTFTKHFCFQNIFLTLNFDGNKSDPLLWCLKIILRLNLENYSTMLQNNRKNC